MDFIDQYLPAKVPGYPCASAPRFKTTIQTSWGGGEGRNQEWEHPLHRFTLPGAAGRNWDVIEALMLHWRIMRGPFYSFPWRDPLDFASRSLPAPDQAPAVTATDQAIGTGDGFTDSFQLVKTYSLGPETYQRSITLPVLDTVVVAIDGVLVDPATYTVTRTGGLVQFDVAPPAPASGHPRAITAGYLFDVQVRFESDDMLEGILRTFAIGGFADITMIEVRPC